MLDINGFKDINDTYGHKVGDIALQDAAEELMRIFLDERFEIFRIGGDEFAVIALDMSESEMNDELDAVAEVVLHETLGCRFAYGVSEVHFSGFNAVENAFERADRAMYECKLRGKESDS
jgi:diguanylate cyclase (GGDEF)-like protein